MAEGSNKLVPVAVVGGLAIVLGPLIPVIVVAAIISSLMGAVTGIAGAEAGASTYTAGAICDPTASDSASPGPSASAGPPTRQSGPPAQPSPSPGASPVPPGGSSNAPSANASNPPSSVATAIAAGVAKTYGLTTENQQNAEIIISVGQQKNVPVFGLVVAIATALQESGLVNLTTATDHDSLGLFQQRPSQGWGTVAQVTDPTYAAGAFYDALLKVPNWQAMSLTDAAQAVQRSAFPDAYAKWETEARDIVGQDAGAACPTLGTGSAKSVIAAASQWIGKAPYSWGGGDANGPTKGICDGSDCSAENVVGFDCSGLALYAYAQIKITLPHGALDQYNLLHKVPRDQLLPGDLLFYATDPSNPATIHHVTIFLGGDQMVEAATTGTMVRITTGIWTDDYYSKQFISGGRP
jgi:cell wall-associated NlpC family hydrolase